MDVQLVWIIAAVATLTAGLAGFYVGRSRPDAGARQAAEARIQALEAELRQRQAELDRQQAELEGYRGAVDAHFDRTATLFVEMAGSYRNLFQHLSSDYEKLSSGSTHERFQARITALLLEDDRTLSTAAGAQPESAMVPEQPEADPPQPDPPGSNQRDRTRAPGG